MEKKVYAEVLHIIHGFVSLCCIPETRINSSARKMVSFVSRPPNNNGSKSECLLRPFTNTMEAVGTHRRCVIPCTKADLSTWNLFR